MVQRRDCHGLDLVLYQARTHGPAHHLPGSHRTCPLPLVYIKIKSKNTNTEVLGGSFRRILHSSLHLALHANCTEQIRVAH
jgi:hypothetical protein